MQFFSSDIEERQVSTVQNDWWTPSGSRWEPVPEATTATAPEMAPEIVSPLPARTTPRRAHRRTAAALLLTLLGAGAVSAGAAYAQSDGAAAGRPPGPPSSQVTGDGGHGGRHAHGAPGASS